MKIKAGVYLNPVVAIAIGMQIVEPIFEKYGQELVITSMMDGKHRKGSKHYAGNAFDCRIWNLGGNVPVVVDECRKALGEDFDVVAEKTHIHIEYQPKYGVNGNG